MCGKRDGSGSHVWDHDLLDLSFSAHGVTNQTKILGRNIAVSHIIVVSV